MFFGSKKSHRRGIDPYEDNSDSSSVIFSGESVDGEKLNQSISDKLLREYLTKKNNLPCLPTQFNDVEDVLTLVERLLSLLSYDGESDTNKSTRWSEGLVRDLFPFFTSFNSELHHSEPWRKQLMEIIDELWIDEDEDEMKTDGKEGKKEISSHLLSSGVPFNLSDILDENHLYEAATRNYLFLHATPSWSLLLSTALLRLLSNALGNDFRLRPLPTGQQFGPCPILSTLYANHTHSFFPAGQQTLSVSKFADKRQKVLNDILTTLYLHWSLLPPFRTFNEWTEEGDLSRNSLIDHWLDQLGLERIYKLDEKDHVRYSHIWTPGNGASEILRKIRQQVVVEALGRQFPLYKQINSFQEHIAEYLWAAPPSNQKQSDNVEGTASSNNASPSSSSSSSSPSPVAAVSSSSFSTAASSSSVTAGPATQSAFTVSASSSGETEPLRSTTTKTKFKSRLLQCMYDFQSDLRATELLNSVRSVFETIELSISVPERLTEGAGLNEWTKSSDNAELGHSDAFHSYLKLDKQVRHNRSILAGVVEKNNKCFVLNYSIALCGAILHQLHSSYRNEKSHASLQSRIKSTRDFKTYLKSNIHPKPDDGQINGIVATLELDKRFFELVGKCPAVLLLHINWSDTNAVKILERIEEAVKMVSQSHSNAAEDTASTSSKNSAASESKTKEEAP